MREYIDNWKLCGILFTVQNDGGRNDSINCIWMFVFGWCHYNNYCNDIKVC